MFTFPAVLSTVDPFHTFSLLISFCLFPVNLLRGHIYNLPQSSFLQLRAGSALRRAGLQDQTNGFSLPLFTCWITMVTAMVTLQQMNQVWDNLR